MPADLLLVAALLRRGRSLDRFSSALSLIAVLFGLAPWLGAAGSLSMASLCVLLLVVGMLEKYWALRVALDAELFAHLAQTGDGLEAQTRALDQALLNLRLQGPEHGVRTWDSRCQGALGLLRKQVLCLLLQVMIVVFGIFMVFA